MHSLSKVDVVNDIAGSVGIFLTAEAHGLKLLGEEEKKGKGGGKKKKVCSVGGCPNIVYYNGRTLCKKHEHGLKLLGDEEKKGGGGKKKKKVCVVVCSVEGCSTNAVGRGVCSEYSALGTCAFNKCTSAFKSRGRCKKHGGGSTKSVHGERLHHYCQSTRCVQKTWCIWNVHV